MREDSEGRLAEEVQEREKRGHVHQMGILTVDASGAAARQESGDITWHEMVNAYRTKKILSGGLRGKSLEPKHMEDMMVLCHIGVSWFI